MDANLRNTTIFTWFTAMFYTTIGLISCKVTHDNFSSLQELINTLHAIIATKKTIVGSSRKWKPEDDIIPA